MGMDGGGMPPPLPPLGGGLGGSGPVAFADDAIGMSRLPDVHLGLRQGQVHMPSFCSPSR